MYMGVESLDPNCISLQLSKSIVVLGTSTEKIRSGYGSVEPESYPASPTVKAALTLST